MHCVLWSFCLRLAVTWCQRTTFNQLVLLSTSSTNCTNPPLLLTLCSTATMLLSTQTGTEICVWMDVHQSDRKAVCAKTRITNRPWKVHEHQIDVICLKLLQRQSIHTQGFGVVLWDHKMSLITGRDRGRVGVQTNRPSRQQLCSW